MPPLKTKPKYILIGLLFLAAVIFIIWLSSLNHQIKKPIVRIGSINVPVEIAQTETARKEGLSGRPSLDKNKGMLFVFSQSGLHQFWMPKMNFPIDIIWIDGEKVVGITPNISDDFNPENPQVYSPPQPIQYVLEVNAGFSAEKNVKIGDIVVLKDI